MQGAARLNIDQDRLLHFMTELLKVAKLVETYLHSAEGSPGIVIALAMAGPEIGGAMNAIER